MKLIRTFTPKAIPGYVPAGWTLITDEGDNIYHIAESVYKEEVLAPFTVHGYVNNHKHIIVMYFSDLSAALNWCFDNAEGVIA